MNQTRLNKFFTTIKKTDYWLYFLLTTVICLGIFFRFVNLEQKVYWHDEVHTSLRVAGYESENVEAEIFTGEIITVADLLKYQKLHPHKTFSDAMNAFSKHPEHPPLYYILQRWWQTFFGSSIATARSLSAIFSVLTLAAIYWFALELFNCNQTALISTSLIAISPMHILYAQEARQYSLWALTTIVHSVFFLKAIKQKSWSNWWLYSLSLLLNLYTSLLSFLILITHSLYLLIARGTNNLKNWLRFIVFSSIAIILFIPWFRIIVSNYERMKWATDWLIQNKPFTDLAKSWGTNVHRLFADFSWAQYNQWSDLFVYLSYFLIAFSTIYLIKKVPINIWIYLILFTVIPFIILVIPDLFFGSIRSTVTRYLFAYYLGIHLIVGYYLSTNIFSPEKINFATIIYLTIIIIGISSNLDILKSVAWWNKALGYQANYITQMINQVEKPLIITEQRGISIGVITSLGHSLKPSTNLQLVGKNMNVQAHHEFADIFVVNPSLEFITKIEIAYQRKLTDTYQQRSFNNPSLYYLNNTK